MRLLVAATLTGLVVGLAPAGGPSAGVCWDLLLATGYMGLVLLAVLGWDSEVPVNRPRLRLHRNLAILATGLVAVHAIGFPLLDPILIEYLKPTAPLYMLVGIGAAVALLAVTVSSLPGPRNAIYRTFPRFRSWHRLLFGIILGGSVWHTLGTGFTLAYPWQLGMVGLLAGLAPGMAYLARRADRPLYLTPPPGSERAADAQSVLAAAVAIGFCLAWSAVKWSLCATC
jgi:hypothetical protein